MLARKVITRRGRRFRGYFPSRKLGRMMEWESLNERNVILLFEFSPGVLSYQAQPALIHYHDGQDTRAYYPDFEVIFLNGEAIHVEVKLARELAKRVVQDKYRAIAADYNRRQQGFRILTDHDLLCGSLLSNLQLLASIQRMAGRTIEFRRLWNKHFTSQLVPFADAEERLGRATLLALLAVGVAHCDLRQPLAGETPVHLIQEGGCDVTYLL